MPVEASRCPSCGAALRDAADGDVLGVTQIDPAALVAARASSPGRIATWLGAESDRPTTPSLAGKIEPPSDEVRAEMLRLELAAIDAEIEAKAQPPRPSADAPARRRHGRSRRPDAEPTPPSDRRSPSDETEKPKPG